MARRPPILRRRSRTLLPVVVINPSSHKAGDNPSGSNAWNVPVTARSANDSSPWDVSIPKVTRAHAACSAELLQLRVLRLGFLQYGNVRVGVFPQREEILIRGACAARIARRCVCARQPKLSQSVLTIETPGLAAR